MDAVLRAVAIYFVLLIVFRIGGKRSVAQITTFDFVLLLIVGEATQQALLGEDFSITQAALVIVTLVGLDVLLSRWSKRWPWLERVLDGTPLVIVDDGKLLHDRMRKARIEVDDILEAARRHHGLERLDQVKYAILERGGSISIVPREKH